MTYGIDPVAAVWLIIAVLAIAMAARSGRR